ncbi:endonuclease [Catellatospora sp. TT07R-123]|uniref:endonuclease/exonuclease/phosphatase family protein n=1 Tax=Catellatospora sp. TT07R-123 TaxID=2733863 RepID=UPI001B187CF4|nr:endonuclease/exonuclease/phosphatase family protein [Catellatospora sp. TT07R-123]GHJ45107.1 endonuclease [Catellatospora sp. TT07R-123]
MRSFLRFTVRSVLPWLLVLPGAMWALLRLTGADEWYPMTQLIAFTPYVALGALVPLAVLLVWRRWPAAAAAGLVAVLLAAVVLPRMTADGDPLAGAKGPELRVLTANVLAGSASSAGLVALVREQRVDVLAIQEMTPTFVAELEAAGLRDTLPYWVTYPDPNVGGSGLFARYPLRDAGMRLNPWHFGQAKAVLTMPGGQEVALESMHPTAPSTEVAVPPWRTSYADQQPATPDGPVRVLLGDFNATLDHHFVRDLVDSGYRDAADVTGHGLIGTWGPYDGDRIPPVVLDRVLADRRVGIRDYRVLSLHGSDHRPVLAELVLP